MQSAAGGSAATPNGATGTGAPGSGRRCRPATAPRHARSRPAVWQRVEELVATTKPREYDIAVQLLVDLRDLAERDGGTAVYRQRLIELRATHARKPSLLEQLDVSGLGY
jgi:hypothetical protein